ncbi:putative histone-lysine N-methyltransferase chromatin remodeling SET family [Rosa chinensis]|uniref:Putative histone-lysine N-methyltransferase chromatin remodeling SET family n=1 Tax=Rosa chinensis TaxID=74649 RepID=A0A2P6QZQ6_ROSCH|nr:histone-lysine N-methyltransferase ASHR2 [Rosa chinensis]PRQ39674.1 putative histone-lysine N-methyltransferase chromatin remodeling SET family [Rosa chinensis]
MLSYPNWIDGAPSEFGLRSSRDYGIYRKPSFFNHDCLPHACRFDYVDEGSIEIIVRMIHDVPEGREIYLSYFHVNQAYSSRQRTLAEDYGFVCQCDRCKVEANWSDNEDEQGGSAEIMDEDQDQEMEGESESEAGSAIEVEDQGEADFPHAYFFVRFMCSRTNCWGTLVPLPLEDDGTRNSFGCYGMQCVWKP